MKLVENKARPALKSAAKFGIACLLIAMMGLGAIIAHTLTIQRRAEGDIVLELYRKGANGQWKVIDRAKGRISLSASVLDLAGRKEFKSNLKWEPRSEQGHQINLKEAGPGKATVNAATGEVFLEAPYSVSVDGHSFSLSAKLTNQSISTPVGSFSGKRLEVSENRLSAGVVGYVEIKEPNVVDLLAKEPIGGPAVSDKKGVKEPTVNTEVPDKKGLPSKDAIASRAAGETLIVVIKAQGSSTKE